MSYKKAEKILPRELLEQVQQYVDGEYLYIPRLSGHKQNWGSATTTRRELQERNRKIYEAYQSGASTAELAREFYLSPKSIQRILSQMKQK